MAAMTAAFIMAVSSVSSASRATTASRSVSNSTPKADPGVAVVLVALAGVPR